MAFKANDGSLHTNHSTMKQANMKMRGMAKAPAASTDDASTQTEDPLSSPESQACFSAWAQAGVSPEEVAQAYAQFEQTQSGGASAPGSSMVNG